MVVTMLKVPASIPLSNIPRPNRTPSPYLSLTPGPQAPYGATKLCGMSEAPASYITLKILQSAILCNLQSAVSSLQPIGSPRKILDAPPTNLRSGLAAAHKEFKFRNFLGRIQIATALPYTEIIEKLNPIHPPSVVE